jgi:hypothetical protein
MLSGWPHPCGNSFVLLLLMFCFGFDAVHQAQASGGMGS